ncbi:MAG: NaeI family type II restriction endonuclease [Actinomycetota bacterium]|nr:NaeI family type II restriction endonuclease [Actinomycetota bacterium]
MEPHSDEVRGELERVATWLLDRDLDGQRTAAVLRESIDQVLDGPRTGRFRYEDLRKTEKTHVGTIVEINLGKEFDLADGDTTDYRIAGIEVDCKYSMRLGGWELPLESLGHIVLLLWADDAQGCWSAGLWRVDEAHLSGQGNRDRKRKMSRAGQDQIRWLWQRWPLEENLLLHLPAEELEAIFRHGGGQQRINELFRLVQGRIVRREVVLTVARQKDGPKRARDARLPRHLGREGIIVLGHDAAEVAVAEHLGLATPIKGEWIAVRVTPVDETSTRRKFKADGGWWATAEDDEESPAAPTILRPRSLE